VIRVDWKSVLIIGLLLGILVGMVHNELLVPTLNEDMPYYHGTRGKSMIAIAFNVDWGQEYIPAILKILEEKEIKINFFVTGAWVKKYPDLLKNISNSGHEIGNHGYKHVHPKELSRDELIFLIKENEDLIFNIIGKRTNLFAPPYGEVDNRISKIASSIGYKTIMWSADTIDWQRPSPEIIVQRAVNKIDDGGIILMHPTSPTLKALPDIIEKLVDRGFKFVTITELLKT
jgi:probable sporulation protein (polysaccharide deacetylase family)